MDRKSPSGVAAVTQPAAAHMRPTRTRHVVLAMTVAIYMITYMDRTVISSAAPVIQKEFGFSLITSCCDLSV